jgi:hypothetical protein
LRLSWIVLEIPCEHVWKKSHLKFNIYTENIVIITFCIIFLYKSFIVRWKRYHFIQNKLRFSNIKFLNYIFYDFKGVTVRLKGVGTFNFFNSQWATNPRKLDPNLEGRDNTLPKHLQRYYLENLILWPRQILKCTSHP